MDWTIVTGAAGVVGGFVIATVKDLLTRHLAVKDKERERLVAREDTHQRELREGYAEFIAAYSRFLGVAGSLVAHAQAMLDLKNKERENALRDGASAKEADQIWEMASNSELNNKISRLEDEFVTAAHEGNRRAVVVVLLEGGSAFATRLKEIMSHALNVSEDRRNFDGARRQLRDHQHRLDELTQLLGGRFAPEVAQPRSLVGDATPRLGTGSS